MKICTKIIVMVLVVAVHVSAKQKQSENSKQGDSLGKKIVAFQQQMNDTLNELLAKTGDRTKQLHTITESVKSNTNSIQTMYQWILNRKPQSSKSANTPGQSKIEMNPVYSNLEVHHFSLINDASLAERQLAKLEEQIFKLLGNVDEWQNNTHWQRYDTTMSTIVDLVQKVQENNKKMYNLHNPAFSAKVKTGRSQRELLGDLNTLHSDYKLTRHEVDANRMTIRELSKRVKNLQSIIDEEMGRATSLDEARMTSKDRYMETVTLQTALEHKIISLHEAAKKISEEILRLSERQTSMAHNFTMSKFQTNEKLGRDQTEQTVETRIKQDKLMAEEEKEMQAKASKAKMITSELNILQEVMKKTEQLFKKADKG